VSVRRAGWTSEDAPLTGALGTGASGGTYEAPMTWTDEERAALDLMRQRGAFLSDADLIRGALWWYALFLDLDPHPDVFALTAPVIVTATETFV
jgi:hypothetical protein